MCFTALSPSNGGWAYAAFTLVTATSGPCASAALRAWNQALPAASHAR